MSRIQITNAWRVLAAGVVASAALMAAPAHAGEKVYWSVSVNAPVAGPVGYVGTTVGNHPYAGGVYVQPAPVVVVPSPVVYHQAPPPRPVWGAYGYRPHHYVHTPVRHAPPRGHHGPQRGHGHGHGHHHR